MLSAEGHAVAITANFNCAVALATFGFPYRLERLRDEPTGETASCLWHIEPEPILYSKSHPDEPMPALRAQTVLRQLKAGTLQQLDPGHPIIDVLEALNIYERIRTYMERATPFRIAITSQGRATLIEGPEPAADNNRAAVRTDSLELATAMARLGVPLLGCIGQAPYRQIILAAQGYDLGVCPVNTKELAGSINDGTLQIVHPDNPALWAITGLRNRKAMRAQMKRDAIPMLLRNPRSLSWERRHKSVIIPGTATGQEIDRARQNL